MDKMSVVKGITLAADFKTWVSQYYRKNRKLPDSSSWTESGTSINPDFSETAISMITVGDNGPGTVTIYFRATAEDPYPVDIDGTWIVLTPDIFSNKIEWRCGGTVPEIYKPNACQ